LINDPYTALNYILQNNSNITSLLSTYQGTSIPLIAGGILAEVEIGLPAIVFNNDNITPNRKIEDSIFTINCYAKTERESFIIARTVVFELNGLEQFADGYPITTTCKVLASIPDPVAKEVNTAVEIRLFNINGGA